MVILLVRHAHAGSKGCSGTDDSLRPVSARGRVEAAALADSLIEFAPAGIISSPLLRCVQTVEPLCARAGLVLEQSEHLRPEAGEAGAVLMHEVEKRRGPIVLCTHGEVIDGIQRSFRGRAPRNFSHLALHEKGSAWVLHYATSRITGADYLPPPR